MDDIFCREIIACSQLRLAGLAAAQSPAFFQQLRACRPVNGTVHSAAAQETAVGCIDDAHGFCPGDIQDIDADGVLPFCRQISFEDHLNEVFRQIERLISRVDDDAAEVLPHNHLLLLKTYTNVYMLDDSLHSHKL